MAELETKTVSVSRAGNARPAERDLPGPHLAAGSTLSRYVVLHRIGTGGMAVVYAAYDPELGRKVALKVLRTDLVDADRREIPRREAKALARLRHPNVVTVYDLGEDEIGTFLAMEHIDGRPLGEWLNEAPRSWREILEVFLQAGRGLAAAHAENLLHQDFKPSNLMVTTAGQARVTDFGLAQVLIPARRSHGGSRSPRGTRAFLAPERWDDDDGDPRGDQFSFCVTLYWALFGRLPFDDDDPEVYLEQVRAGAIRPPEPSHAVPDWVSRPLLRGLAADPGDRYPSLNELLTALSPTLRERKSRRRHLATLAAVVAGALAVYWGMRPAPVPPCGGAEGRLDGIWDDRRRQEMRAAFSAIEAPFAADTRVWIEQALDGYRAQWLAMHRDACEATHVRGEQSHALLDRRMLCLDDRLAELGAHVDSLTRADAAVASRAGDATLQLRSLSACGNRSELVQWNLPELDVEQQAELERVRATVEAQYASFRSGARVDGGALEASAVTARELRYPALEARALQLSSYLAYDRGDFSGSFDQLFGALQSAVAGRDRVLQIELYAALAETPSIAPESSLGSHRWLALGEATLASLGSDHPPSRIRLHHAKGWLAWQEGEMEEAGRHLSLALELGEELWGPRDPRLASVLTDLSNTLAGLPGTRRDEVIALVQRAIEIRERAFGRSNPKLGPPLVGLAAALAEDGRFVPALEAGRRALDITRSFHGEGYWEVCYPLTLIGQIHIAQDLPDRAFPYLEDARRRLEDSLGHTHPLMATVLHGLAEARLLQRRPRDAADLLRSADAIELPESHGERAVRAAIAGRLHVERGELAAGVRSLRQAKALARRPLSLPQALGLETALGIALLEQGELDEASDCFTRALDLGAARVPHLIAEARFGRARILARRGDPGADAEARLALEEARGSSPRSRRIRRSVERWLAAYASSSASPPGPLGSPRSR